MEPLSRPDAGPSGTLHSLFEDLEQQAAGLELERRDAEVDDRLRDAYAEVELVDRLHASLGAPVALAVTGSGTGSGEQVRGRLVRVGADWVLVDTGAAEVLVPLAAVLTVHGLADRVVPAAARPVWTRLRLTSCLRRVAEEGERQALRLSDGRLMVGELGRVGRDFVELWQDRDGTGPGEERATVVPLAALSWVRSA